MKTQTLLSIQGLQEVITGRCIAEKLNIWIVDTYRNGMCKSGMTFVEFYTRIHIIMSNNKNN